ncbi:MULTISPECIES: roadblock/LC7 domain-containing protein [unclassified Streptomyces]|uniref:roadblock/LC7 domain-containing protein n=1 Tax=unclassified Streptomyces TaxID=2593676 RepID=UPI00136A87EC|nr:MULTISPECIES: roadblock/LC7 domain-containing protein [unclassified Streptomyces]MYV53609.1 roadblock/LC7 domain-containing protein [Streptomyces sp. SID3212]WSJ45060.1 roadblock/LC7 domain-containing protein [Streptomyces sp. NBC_01317]
MTNSVSKVGDLGWILDELLRTPHTLRAILLSSDGLMSASSEGVERDMADRMAAAVSGMQALSREAAEFADCEGAWEMTMIQYRGGYLFAMAAGDGSYLAVSADGDADVENVSYAMEETVDRLGQQLGIASRVVTGAGS